MDEMQESCLKEKQRRMNNGREKLQGIHEYSFQKETCVGDNCDQANILHKTTPRFAKAITGGGDFSFASSFCRRVCLVLHSTSGGIRKVRRKCYDN